MSNFRVTRCRYPAKIMRNFLFYVLILFWPVVALMLSVGFVFAATPQKSAAAKYSNRVLPAPTAPNVVLYDQYDNEAGGAYTSQDYEAPYDAYDNQAADDFVVPAGVTWNIDEVDVQGVYTVGPADSFHVFVYADAGGLPGTNVYTGLAQPYSTSNNIDFAITLSPAAVLTEGTYWVSVQVRNPNGQWFWNDRSVQAGNPAAWQNPGGGFQSCPTWFSRSGCIGGAPDHVFRLNGTGVPCVYSNDFNDATQEWLEEKPIVTQPGDGFLHLTPLKKKAIAVADSSFAGGPAGTYTFDVQFSGGTDPKNWVYITRVDKKNQLELLIKAATGKLVVKDRNQSVLAKAKADFTWVANTPYQVVVNYDGTNVDVSVNGTPVIVDFVPSRSLPTANIGAAANDNTLLLDNVCFN